MVAAPQIRDVVVKQVRQFAARHAPDVAIGLLDLNGLQVFSGSELESLNASRPRSSKPQQSASKSGDPFSDLNQWMLKVLLARYLGDDSNRLLHAPGLAYRNASELAKAAQVSVMSASRFVRMMKEQGFLHEAGPPLRVVRLDDLLELWQASYVRPVKDLPARWILRGQPDALPRALEAYGEFACLGLFAAAEALGYGFVQGAPVHILVQHVDSQSLKRMRLEPAGPGERPDVLLRVPLARESVFRGMAVVDHLKACDVLQAWLDVRQHPARGREQAAHLWKRVIKPMIHRAQADAD